MTLIKNKSSIAAILSILLSATLIVQNFLIYLDNQSLIDENHTLTIELEQITTLNEEIRVLKDENQFIQKILLEEKAVADNYRKLVGDYNHNDLVAKAKEILSSSPLDFETAYIVAKYADQFNLNVSMILSVMELESNFSQYEVGAHEDRGYMQIIPLTEKWLAETYGHEYGLDYDPDRIFEPEYNIGLASIYLSLLRDAYGNDYNRILSEYNRGPSNLQSYFEENETYETTYSRVILSRESKYYALND
ncbi:MAG: hypothetical protein AVO33_05355 [delta proteobacterium ML8_F1]|nr:MAG: hypothetical protein AVO33_05355 [delta proteobacterium ML8_F1]